VLEGPKIQVPGVYQAPQGTEASKKPPVQVGTAAIRPPNASQTKEAVAAATSVSPGIGITRPLPEYPITSKFGPRKAPKPGASTNHKAIDIGTYQKSGVPIPLNFEMGKVAKVGWAKGGGNTIWIDDLSNPGYQHIYMHMDRKAPYKKGDILTRGQILGYVGNTGVGTGPHLHYAISKNGKPIDPESVFGPGQPKAGTAEIKPPETPKGPVQASVVAENWPEEKTASAASPVMQAMKVAQTKDMAVAHGVSASMAGQGPKEDGFSPRMLELLEVIAANTGTIAKKEMSVNVTGGSVGVSAGMPDGSTGAGVSPKAPDSRKPPPPKRPDVNIFAPNNDILASFGEGPSAGIPYRIQKISRGV